jgi:hyperosmotically inducible protein
MRASLTQFAACLVLVVAAPLAAADTPVRKDQQVANDIARSVVTYPQFTIFDTVGGEVHEGVVTLTGKVTQPYKKTDIERRVAKIDGVRQITNKIGVLPLSTADDNLRYRISRSIYGNANFWNYATQANPPIHIIVENGHVTLVGVVNNYLDKTLARNLAYQFGAFSVTNNLKTDEEMREELEKKSSS